MKKQPQRSHKAWTPGEKQQLKKLIAQNTPTRLLGLKLKRTPEAAQQKANELGLSTKPVNKPPYNRRKK